VDQSLDRSDPSTVAVCNVCTNLKQCSARDAWCVHRYKKGFANVGFIAPYRENTVKVGIFKRLQQGRSQLVYRYCPVHDDVIAEHYESRLLDTYNYPANQKRNIQYRENFQIGPDGTDLNTYLATH
jgi:hypothetical protein